MSDDQKRESSLLTAVPTPPLGPMLHPNGSVFTAEEIAAVTATLESMSTAERQEYLRQNAAAVSASPLEHLLIVSGPGTGKTILFADRIEYWGAQYDGTILVTTFVKKLAKDLESQLLSSSSKLSKERKASVQPKTLHALARSVVEKAMPWNGFKRNVHVVPKDDWDHLIWNDAASNLIERQAWVEFWQRRNKDADMPDQSLSTTAQRYRQLCRYYNAASFSEMILLARQALEENAQLFTCDCVIVDELQDFNKAESLFLQVILRNADSWLMAGDDDQVLYDTLKQSSRDLIVDMYNDPSVAKAMLPLCSRCGSHIVHAASQFMQRCRSGESNCIEKPLISLKHEEAPRIQMICCAKPTSALAYLEWYLTGISSQLNERRAAMSRYDANAITDPYLLILAHTTKCRMLGTGGRDKLLELITPYRTAIRTHSDGYYAVQDCLAWQQYPMDNWLCRRVLAWCRCISESTSREAAQFAFANQVPLCVCKRDCVMAAQAVCLEVQSVLTNADLAAESKATRIQSLLRIQNIGGLVSDIESGQLSLNAFPTSTSLDELILADDSNQDTLSAADLMTITGSKGLSANEVVILGFDQMNTQYVTDRAMYVAMTRARDRLTLVTILGGGVGGLPSYFDFLPESDVQCMKFTKKDGHPTPVGTKEQYRRYVNRLAQYH